MSFTTANGRDAIEVEINGVPLVFNEAAFLVGAILMDELDDTKVESDCVRLMFDVASLVSGSENKKLYR